MEEKKKKSKIWVVLLVVVLIIAGLAIGYIKYLEGDFNEVLSKNESTKDLMVVDLDTDKFDDQNSKEYELKNGIESEYYYDEQGKIEIAEIELELDSTKINSKTLKAAKSACKALKGVDFTYEESNGKIEIDLKIAPNDIDESLFDKMVSLKIMTTDQATQYKELLKNGNAEEINKVLEELKY